MNHKKILFVLLIGILLFQQAINAQVKIEIANGNSLFFVPNRLHKDTVNKYKVIQEYNLDKKIALTLYNALSNKDIDSIKFAGNFYLNNKNYWKILDYCSSLSWICKCIALDNKDLKNELKDPLSEYLFYFFTDNDYYNLKDYLKIKFHLDNVGKNEIVTGGENENFILYRDLLRYDDPNREKRELTSEILNYFPVKSGDKVIEMGCGVGYYSVRLSKIVGEKGKVFATDIAKFCIDHLNKVIERTGIKNLVPVITEPTRIGVSDSVDAVFVNELFYEFYLVLSDKERSELFISMKEALKKNGYLIIMDRKIINNPGEKKFIDPRLIIAQLAYWGFSYIDYKEFSNGDMVNYVVILKHTNIEAQEQTLVSYGNERPISQSFLLNVNSRKSLAYVRNYEPSMNVTSEKGKVAAELAYNFFETGDTVSARKAINLFDSIIRIENFGGEYGAIQWLCEVQSNPKGKGKLMLKKDPLMNSFYTTMTNNNDSLIKCFLIQKYNLFTKEKRQVPDSVMTFLNDYILNLNPLRDSLEKTSSILKAMTIKKGQVIADIGCSAGYFTYKFSGLVGDKGRVYALEENNDLVDALNNFVKEQDINNVEILKGEFNAFSLNEKADIIFMSSLYLYLYSSYDGNDREKFVKCIKENLKLDGKLVIVDNGPADDGSLPDYESYIAKELIMYKLAFYGFELINDIQITPRRYMLTFRL